MNLFDKLALMGRRYEPRISARSGDHRFSLADLLLMFDRKSILELTAVLSGRPSSTVRPNAERKLKVSLLDDGISALPSERVSWYEVQQTAPQGDMSRVKLIARDANGQNQGEVWMLVGPRSFDQYFAMDPLFENLERRS